MEGFGQYIFIILIIFISIMNALKSVRKKASQQSSHPQPLPGKEAHSAGTQNIDDWEKWFKQDEQYEEEEETQANPTPSFLNTEDVIHNSYSPIVEEKKRSPLSSTPEKNNEALAKNDKISLKTKEDARRAILYSEIIKRKY